MANEGRNLETLGVKHSNKIKFWPEINGNKSAVHFFYVKSLMDDMRYDDLPIFSQIDELYFLAPRQKWG